MCHLLTRLSLDIGWRTHTDVTVGVMQSYHLLLTALALGAADKLRSSTETSRYSGLLR